MPMWRCPHCGTPQAETARCWVCRRSSTACGTCRNFRRSVAGSLGYCGLDRRRQPLVGDEIRECWEAGTAAADPALGATAIRTAADLRPATGRAARVEFIEVHGRLASAPTAPTAPTAPAPEAATSNLDPFAPGSDASMPVPPSGSSSGDGGWRDPGWSLWGDPDR